MSKRFVLIDDESSIIYYRCNDYKEMLKYIQSHAAEGKTVYESKYNPETLLFEIVREEESTDASSIQ